MTTSPRRIGLLGGTFDPPHLGHLVVAEQVRDALGLDEVRLLVAGAPWMKGEITPAADRLAMVELAAADDPALVADAREIRRDGPTYTADTLEELASEEPDAAWFFVLGADAAAKLPQWRRVEDALARATFVVVGRHGSDAELDDPRFDAVVRVDTPRIEISSTDIRRRVADGRSVRYLVPASVHRYIQQHELYRSDHGR